MTLELRQAPRRFSLYRRAFFNTVETLFVLLGGRRFYRRFFLSHGRFLEREEVVRVEDLAAEFDGFTIAQLTDFHAGPFLRTGSLRDVVEAVNRREPDVCVLTGDFITHQVEEAAWLLDDLGQLRARHGIFAVFGNHDYKGRREREIVSSYARIGVRFLRNDAVRFDARGGRSVALTGVEDLEEGKIVDLDAARSAVTRQDAEIVLCHNPSGAPQIAREGCCAILSGHTHGTQIDAPFLRTLGPKHPGLRVECGPTSLIVSRGVGVVGVPLRWRAPAEVVYCKLERTTCTAASV